MSDIHDIRPGSTVVLPPIIMADVLGVRRTRVGRWVYQGRTYRTLRLALRRAPKSVRVDGVTIVVDPRGLVKRRLVLQPLGAFRARFDIPAPDLQRWWWTPITARSPFKPSTRSVITMAI